MSKYPKKVFIFTFMSFNPGNPRLHLNFYPTLIIVEADHNNMKIEKSE